MSSPFRGNPVRKNGEDVMKELFLSVVIPSYNEERNLERGVLREVYDFLKTKKFSWEVIISDDGSSDNSLRIVKDQIKEFDHFKVLENPHGGKPSALNFGIEAAQGKYILFTDMDQSTPIRELDKLLPFVNEGKKVVIGSRGISRKNFPFYRRLGSIVFMQFRKSFVLSDINDTQCGFKLFDRKLVAQAFPKLEFFRHDQEAVGWKVTSYDVELLHIIEKLGATIAEVRVIWKDADVSKTKGGGISRYFRESKEMFMQILRVKLNDMKGMYDN